MQIRTYVSCERAMTRSRACSTRGLETAFTSSPNQSLPEKEFGLIAARHLSFLLYRSFRRGTTTYHIRSISKTTIPNAQNRHITFTLSESVKCLKPPPVTVSTFLTYSTIVKALLPASPFPVPPVPLPRDILFPHSSEPQPLTNSKHQRKEFLNRATFCRSLITPHLSQKPKT
jgi:hypothetical protein